MITKTYKRKWLCTALFTLHCSLFTSVALLCSLFTCLALTSCDDFIYSDSDQVIYDDGGRRLNSDADTLWAVAGIMNKMQAIADRTILLGEMRGDLVNITEKASTDLRQLASFDVTTDNKYAHLQDYYAVINNCNYYLAKVDTAVRNNRNEYLFMKEFAAVKAFRAWTYLQLALNYGNVPFITEPILTEEQSEQDYPLYNLQQICEYFAADIAPFATVETPGYESIRNTNSKLFYYPIYVLLGDLYLWSGKYREAAENYYQYISTRNGRNSSYPLTTNAVRYQSSDSRWMSASDSWSTSCFGSLSETLTSQSELITMIPGDSIPSEGNYSELRDLFNTSEGNDYQSSIIPSEAIKALSASQKYCHLTSGGDYVYAPSELTALKRGDQRLAAVYTTLDGVNMISNGKKITNYSAISKHSTRNVHILRRSMVYLRMAEALCRAGYPRFAFQILKTGVNNTVIENNVIPYYSPEHASWLRSFNFPNTQYILETRGGATSENTIGIHGRGCGYSANDTAYVMPDNPAITDSLARLNYQIEQVENLIITESALEHAFEGQRFYDLMRVALRRNDPAFLADKVARRNGTLDASLQQKLMDTKNWFIK